MYIVQGDFCAGLDPSVIYEYYAGGPVRCLSGAAGCSVVIFGIAQIFSFSFVKMVIIF